MTTNTRHSLHVGIDLGGTKLEGIVLDATGRELKRQRAPTARGSYEHVLDGICAFIRDFTHDQPSNFTLGIGTPGSLDSNGLLRNSNTTELNGQPLLDDLQSALGMTIRMGNDANCFALSEAKEGAAANYNTVFGVILGTGTGGGIVIDKQILTGRNKIGGEWGHNPQPGKTSKNKRPCYCGQFNCIETFLSGPGLSQTYFFHSNQQLDAENILTLANDGNSEALAAMQDYEVQLASALATVINLLDPDCIVLGGGLSNIQRLYENIPKLWGSFIFSDSVETVLLPPLHGDSSGVRGAAWLGFFSGL